MLKLFRNFLGEGKVIVDGSRKQIRWLYFEELEALQEKDGLHAANKLKQRHIQWQQQKVKVSLAAQALSNSVPNAMLFCKVMAFSQFQGCETTAEFTKKLIVRLIC